ncbi:MAG: 1-deoxy-D-xylulose-5-phosphate reductoisomerase, partial [Oscillospiraceae bacterium]
IDSEYCAILQAIRSGKRSEIKRIVLTASGGPFFGMNREQLKSVTIKDALNHPNWHMGKKITIDSATLLNKGFEIIEAKWLFSVPIEKIKVVVHPQSVVHSLVEFKDNNMIAQLSAPDMKGVLGYVMAGQIREEAVIQELSLINSSPLEFFDVDSETFKGIELVKFAHLHGELYLSVCNGASEELVKLFLNGKIKFTDIDETLLECLNAVTLEKEEVTEDNIFWADKIGRDFIKEKMAL